VKNQDVTYFVEVSAKNLIMPIVLNCLPWKKIQLISNISVMNVPNLEAIVLFATNLDPSIQIKINEESQNYRIKNSLTINSMILNKK